MEFDSVDGLSIILLNINFLHFNNVILKAEHRSTKGL